ALRARFLREAHITGQLEHPGIVPVYELWYSHADARAFYSMRFIKGRTLRQAASAYHGEAPADLAAPVDFLTLINAFLTVCNTVAYAHSRGIIHRDLKAENVLLGDYGEVLLVDWGLAKVLKQWETEQGAPRAAEDAADLAATTDGQMIGTPVYM